ncbi:MAG: endopeptidase La [Ruminococcaceae bacterium]|nr:endopeptidase La [Oscillospiraceae bacterium]
MARMIEKVEKLRLPVIPLRGLVAFPSIPMNFELEREISKKACEIACAGDMYVFLLSQKDIRCDNPEGKDLSAVGCVAKIKQTLKKPDGNIRVIAEGMCRGQVISVVNENDCLWADVLSKTLTGEPTDIRSEALVHELMDTMGDMLHFLPPVSDEFQLAARSITNPGLLADFIASSLFVRVEDKQQILEIFDPAKRAETAVLVMENEIRLLETEADIHKKVKEQIDENQREYYLREQLKAVQNELGDGGDDEEYYEKIANAHLPKEVEDKLNKELSRLMRTSYGSPEAAVLRNYLDICLEIPWGKVTKDRVDLETARKILNADHDGLMKIKERLLEFLAVKQLNPELRHQILCLVGPPGVGKTSLASSIARAMKRKYVRVSLGGIRDESDIRGHRKTYVASMPGRIVTALTQCGTMNPVMLLDEVDKMCSDAHGDPASALLEVLDGEQNKSFRDHFIELPVDLSECFFIATANTLDTIPRPLIDRMEIIELHTYTPAEKLSIAKNHLLPKQLKRHGLSRRTCKITDDAIRELIEGYTRESGVRNLEREIGSLCRKAAKKLVEEELKSVTIKGENVKDYLGGRKFIDEGISGTAEVGVTNGLAYTEVGGDLLKVEVLPMDGTGKIELTGTLGDVMKESAHIAVSYIRAHAAELGIASDFYKTKDIHIHVPEGAVPKDGPSAGVTLTTSLVSALSGNPVRGDIAMTGEITLTGRVLPIGGLREKSTAAYTAGIRHILIPKDNVKDLEEIDAVVREEVLFTPVSHLSEVLDIAIIRLSKPADAVPEIPAMVKENKVEAFDMPLHTDDVQRSNAR